MEVDLIRYDLLVQEALRGVVRQVLSTAARDGLPGDHHFYIRFRTHARGVRLSARMRERYPDEMTIVLQHQFWDLTVTEQAFEVGLSFQNVPELLSIPFEAITGFADPTGRGFEVTFSVEGLASETPSLEVEETPSSDEFVLPPSQSALGDQVSDREAVSSSWAEALERRTEDKTAAPSYPEAEAQTPQNTPKVVSIDAFRKKNS